MGRGACGPPCASGSDGTGALGDPQGQAHGAGLADGLRLAAVGDGGSLQAVAAVVVDRGGQDVAGLLEKLLLGHDRVSCG